uniref:ATP synthase F0 subunit 8 n=1 Tax=Tricentrus davidi TaxID=3021815 RepID=UPI00237AE1AA|nr:ATP synthase F0 subunit 8 [Tricentrus davidi]WBV77344.1 ATP synthase F0 subunit 8 [Tricentrus davidi]
MPQMAPMWWMTLMIMFNMLTMMMISLTYFNFHTNLMLSTKKKENKFSWKW